MTVADAGIPSGIYRHYKGSLYQVFALAHDADDDERIAVVYIPLQLNPQHLGPRVAVRTLERFVENVCTTAECPRYGLPPYRITCAEHHDVRSRFTYLGSVLTSDMVSD